MVADTKVQFISSENLNAPALPNSWNVLVNALDAALVNGLNLPTVSSITPEDSVITITFASSHKITLGQNIQLSGFSPGALNQKWKVIGVPNTQKVVIERSAEVASVTEIGTARIPPLGYEKTFSATGKGVYRNANTAADHRPFLRVDSTFDASWPSTAAKMARVGVLLHCDGIDDISQTPQLPYNATNPTLNWSVSGNGVSANTCWAKWVYNSPLLGNNRDLNSNAEMNSRWCIVGDENAFYLIVANTSIAQAQQLYGFGVYENINERAYPYFLASMSHQPVTITTPFAATNVTGGYPFRAVKMDASNLAANSSIVHVFEDNGGTANANTHFGKMGNGALSGFVMGKHFLTIGTKLIGCAPHLTFPHSSQDSTFLNVKIIEGEMYLFEPVESRLDTSDSWTWYATGFKIGSL